MGMIRVDLGGTQGCLIITRGIFVGGMWICGGANGFAPTNLSNWYGGTFLAQLLRTIL